jgi:hypothetical protein
MTQNALWVPVTVATLSSVSALAGVIIANWLSDKGKKDERKEARAVAAEDRCRAAGEAVYRAIFEVTTNQAASVDSSLEFLKGEVREEQYKKRLMQTNEALKSVDKAGLRLSIATYFPDVSEDYSLFSKELEKCVQLNNEIIAHVKDGTKDKRDLASRYELLARDLRKIGFDICSKVAKNIK